MSIFLSGSSKQFYLLLIIVFMISCTKNTNLDEVHSQFEYPGIRSESEEHSEFYADGHNLRDEQVIQSLKSYFQSRKDYREELETKYGSALWEVAMTDIEDDNPYVILPFTFERDDFLQGILIAYYAKKKSEWRFFMLTKEGIYESKSAKDIPKQSDGKRNELSKELYAGLFVTYESFLFGQVDCGLLDILGIENSRNGRDIYCYSYSISYQQCWDVYTGSETSLQYQYTDCSYSYNFGSYCIPLNVSPTAEDDPNNPDSPNYEPPTGSSSSPELIEARDYAADLESNYDYDLTAAEEQLMEENPTKAIAVFISFKEAISKTSSFFGHQGENDCSDAFRHAYWNAEITNRIGEYWADAFTTAHESEVPYSKRLAKEMDLYNNNQGRNAASNNPNSIGYGLASIIYNDYLKAGKLKVFNSPSTFNTYLVNSSFKCN